MPLVQKERDRFQTFPKRHSNCKGRLDDHEGVLKLIGAPQLMVGKTRKGIQPRIGKVIYVNGRHGLPPLPQTKLHLVYDNCLQGHLNPKTTKNAA